MGGHSRVASRGNGPAGYREGVDLEPDRASNAVALGDIGALCMQKSRYGACVCRAFGGANSRRAMTTTRNTNEIHGASS